MKFTVIWQFSLSSAHSFSNTGNLLLFSNKESSPFVYIQNKINQISQISIFSFPDSGQDIFYIPGCIFKVPSTAHFIIKIILMHSKWFSFHKNIVMGTFTELCQHIPLFITSHKNKENVMLRYRYGSGHNSLM